tara:strand:+ start:7261 stop:7653 length:393 start_codon:yes stop_codon:yes gene_type:complete
MTPGWPPNFSPSEFQCKCCKTIGNEHTARHLAWELQRIRDLVGPLKINSAYRCPKHNKKVGGAFQSLHLESMAADLVSAEVTPDKLQDTILGLMEHNRIPNGGLGRYNTFTHYDIRLTPARWDHRSKKNG